MRKKLPFYVGLLLRLLKKNYHVYITCITGFDRSPACVIAYLHWITDTSLHAAHNFVTGLHICKPDRPAIAWATWDLIAMVESGIHDGPSTHAVTFVWKGHEGEDVYLVGDFTGNWKEPIKAIHKGGPRYEVDIRLPQGNFTLSTGQQNAPRLAAFCPVTTVSLNSSPASPPNLIRNEPVFASPAPAIHSLLREYMGKDLFEEATAELQKLLSEKGNLDPLPPPKLMK